MSYLIYDQDGELFDVLNFESSKELEIFKKENPKLTVEYTDEYIEPIFSEDLIDDEDYLDEDDLFL